jgi:uncharacterized membrane protein YfcA
LIDATTLDATTLDVLLVIFVATLIRSAFGFGEALIAVPLLALRLPLTIAAPVAVLVSITIAAIIVAQDRRHVEWRSAGWLVFASLFGIPLGLMLLTSTHQKAAKISLAILIILFSVYSLIGKAPAELKTDRAFWLLFCGFISGILGGAYGMNGPPLAVYGSTRRWPARQFRATLQGYFLPASIAGMAGYWRQGLWIPVVTRYYVISLVAVVPAILLGREINHRLGDGPSFQKYVYFALICIGVVLFGQTLK